MQKFLLTIIAVAIIVGGGSFYGGMKYAESKNSRSRFLQENFQNLQSLSPEERQQRFQQMAGHMETGVRGERMGGAARASFIDGEILSKDDKSVTIKLRDGGSKIIFYSETTEVSKSVQGTTGDLAIGRQVSISGKPNSDGRITAQSIQIRPALPTAREN